MGPNHALLACKLRHLGTSGVAKNGVVSYITGVYSRWVVPVTHSQRELGPVPPVLKFRPALRVARAVILFGEVLMATGTVKWFNATKGFGFIQPEDGSKDVFVHISALERAGIARLNEGQRVSYDVVTERGKSAAGNLKAL